MKQWDATLDGQTRENHRLLDGQIRETNEPFEIGTKQAMYPGDFGDPAEDCNCRCLALTRARRALDADELKVMQERAEFFGLDKTESFREFERRYLKAAKEENKPNQTQEKAESVKKPNSSDGKATKRVEKTGKSGIMTLNLQQFAEKDLAKQKTHSLKRGLASFRAQIVEHQRKINNPEKFVPGWADKDEREKNGLIKHWKKEISNFQKSIEDRIAELVKRGEYDE